MSACIVWTGAFHEGYPMKGRRRAHRIAYEAAYGVIPSGHVVHHDCDNKACVNPAHLRTMTRREHMQLHDNIHRARAVSVANKVSATHCKRGHLYASRGYVRSNGTRVCMECQYERIAYRRLASVAA